MLRYLEARSEVFSGRKMSLKVARSVETYLAARSEVSSGL